MDCDYLETKGRIFDIQKYSIHDGPGIRTIIFLKGCALRCKWCCNPESQSYEIQEMNRNGKIEIVGRDVSVGEIIDDINKDRIYYRRSGGGLTLSGGECLLQPEFSRDILHAAKDMGFNTAIESTACAKWEHIEAILPYLDLYLLDIKHMNSVKHKEFTSQSNELILENAFKIANKAEHLIIRVPVIPTFNDTVPEIKAIAEFAKSLPNVNEIHLLPYHRMGRDKYTALNRDYSLDNIKPPDNEHMQRLLGVCYDVGLRAQIGG